MSSQLPPTSTPAHGLVHPILSAMADRGFDVACLQQMQRAAFSIAAQEMQTRHAKGKTTTVQELRDLINRYLASDNANAPHDEVMHSHIACYMQHKVRMQQSAPGQLLREAEDLATTSLPIEEYGKEPRVLVTQILAKHIVSLRDYADRCEKDTPQFARTIRERTRHLETHYVDKQGLQTAIEVIEGIASQSSPYHDDEQDDDNMRPH